MGEYLTSQLKTEFLLNATSSGTILSPNNGWISSTGSFQALSGNSGSHPYLGENNLIFAYIDGSYIYKDFDISSGSSEVSIEVDYIQRATPDTGRVNLIFLMATTKFPLIQVAYLLQDLHHKPFQRPYPFHPMRTK